MGHGNAASHGLQRRHELGGVIRPAGPGKRVSCLFPVAPRRLTGISPTWPPLWGPRRQSFRSTHRGSAPPATGDHSGLPPTPAPCRRPSAAPTTIPTWWSGTASGGLGRVAAGGRQPRSGRPLAIAGSDPADAAVDGGVLQAARCLGPVGRHRLIAYKLDWQISGKTPVARSWVFQAKPGTRPELLVVVEPPAGIEPATPSLPWLTGNYSPHS
jgi:hypothetical protein